MESDWIEELEAQLACVSDAVLREQLLQLVREGQQRHLREVELLRKRVARLEAMQVPAAPQAYRYDAVLWIKGTNRVRGPFCPECYESDGQLLRLQTCSEPLAEEAAVCRVSWKCPDCTGCYDVVDVPKPEELYELVSGGHA